MQIQTKKARIVLAIEAIRTTKKLSVRRVAQMYEVSKSTIRNRMKSCLPKVKKRNIQYILTENEEKTFVRYIFDLDSQRFSPRLNIIQNMADLLRTIYYTTSIGKQWLYNFISHRSKFKTRFSRIYNF